MTKTPTWNAIYEASQKAGFFHGVMMAEENAATTIHEEKAAAPEDHDRLALATLQEVLAYGMLEKPEHDFFVGLGIKF